MMDKFQQAVKDSLQKELNKNKYSSLIKYILNSNEELQTELYLLFDELSFKCLENKNLQERLEKIYDEPLDDLLSEVIKFNPKLNYVSLTSFSGFDEKDEHQIHLDIPVKYDEDINKHFDNADIIINKLKRIIKILLIDYKRTK